MKVSVAIATYNGSEFLAKQLDSILAQSRIPDEIIISDDFSLDDTLDIIRLYREKHPNIILLQNEKNLGYVKNFKNAIENTSGEIVFLSDQDDIWEEKKLETMLEIFTKNQHIKALSSSYSLIDENDRFIKDNKVETGRLKNIKLNDFIKHPKYPGMAMAFRKSLWKEMIENNYLNWDILSAHDWGINYIAARRGSLFYLNKKLVRYRQHDNNLTGILARQNRQALTDRRRKLINELINNASSVLTKNLVELNNLDRMIVFLNTRLDLYNREEMLKLLFYEIKNIRYISIKSILGDMYSLADRRDNKNG